MAVDLAQRAYVADRSGSLIVLPLGTPQGDRHVVEGFVEIPYEPGTDPAAWARRHAALYVDLESVEPRFVLLDLAPYPGIENQSVGLRLNERFVARVDLLPERRRYAVELPVESQRVGRNHLSLRFAERSTPQAPHGHRLCARLYSVSFGPSRGVDLASVEGGPAPLSVETSDGAPTIVAAPGRLSFALSLPADAELRFGLAAAPGTSPDRLPPASVSVEVEGGAVKTLWHTDAAEARREVVVPLPGERGSLVRLSLESGESPWLALSWIAPRVLGDPEPSPLDRTPFSEDEREAGRRLWSGVAKPNVVLIVLDAARARQLGCYGYERPTTPAIDRMAAEGVVFERAYTPAAFTLSAMASVWTSLWPGQHHRGVPYDSALPESVPTLAEHLSARGIPAAGVIGNDMAGPGLGLDRGFSTFEILPPPHNAASFPAWVDGWLEGTKEPFFLYTHFREPHFPYDQPPPFDAVFGQKDGPLPASARTDRYLARRVNGGEQSLSPDEVRQIVDFYDGGLAFVDQQVGRVLQVLEERGLLERSVVILTADHGEALHEHAFLGHTSEVWEEVAHIPLIVRLPGSAAAGRRVDAFASLLDVAPTVAEALGFELPGSEIQGRSLFPVIAGAPGSRVAITRGSRERSLYGLRHERFKYMRHMAFGFERLFDLERDPGEHEDVAAEAPVRAAWYRQLLREHDLRNRTTPARTASERSLTPEQIEQLRALGYLQ